MLARQYATAARTADVQGVPQQALLDYARRLLWQLYHATENHVVFSKRILGMFTLTVRVRDIRPVLVMWLGNPPADIA